MGARMASVQAASGRPLLRNDRARTLRPYLSNSPRAPVRDAWSPAKQHRLGSPAECPAAADRPGAKSGFGDQDTARAEWSLRKVHDSILRLKTAPRIVAKRSTCPLIHECSMIALTAVKLGLPAQTTKSNRTSIRLGRELDAHHGRRACADLSRY